MNTKPWQECGSALITDAQKRMLNAICGDLSAQVTWHGNRLHKDDWRHMLAGTMLGWRMMPGIDMGKGAPGFIMLGGSSLKLTRTQAADAITCGLAIGDRPDEYGQEGQSPARWSDAVLLGLGFNPAELAA